MFFFFLGGGGGGGGGGYFMSVTHTPNLVEFRPMV